VAAAGVAAVSYAVTGNWKQAAIITAGIALCAVGAGAAVLAVKAVSVVKAAKTTETAIEVGMKAKGVSAAAAEAVARGRRIHDIAKAFTRPLERFGVQVDRAIRGTRLRPDWRIGRILIEMKRGSESGIAAGKAVLGRYRDALGTAGRNYLLTYPEKPGQWWKWRLQRIE
jgi:hypothetical protein